MAKCSICGNKVKETFLDKIIGSYIKDEKGKRHLVCFECQKKLHTKDKMLEAMTTK